MELAQVRGDVHAECAVAVATPAVDQALALALAEVSEGHLELRQSRDLCHLRVKVKEHTCRLAFAITDFKLQEWVLLKPIPGICKRPTPFPMELTSFYVPILRAQTVNGLHGLYHKLSRAHLESKKR